MNDYGMNNYAKPFLGVGVWGMGDGVCEGRVCVKGWCVEHQSNIIMLFF